MHVIDSPSLLQEGSVHVIPTSRLSSTVNWVAQIRDVMTVKGLTMKWLLSYLLPWSIGFTIISLVSQQLKFALFSAIWFPNGFCVAALVQNIHNRSHLQSLILLLAYWITMMLTNMLTNSFPIIFVYNIADVIQCLSIYYSFYWLKLIPSSRTNIITHNMLFFAAVVIGSLIGGVVGTAGLYLSAPDIVFSTTLIRWFTVEIMNVMTIAPFLLSLPRLRSFKWSFYPLHIRILQILLFLIMPIPIWFGQVILNSAIGSVVGLYLDFPLVMTSAHFGGILGATLANLIILITNLVFLLIKSEATWTLVVTLNTSEYVALMAMFQTILCVVSIIYAGVVHQRNTAFANIETQIDERTKKLTETMKTLEEAQKKAENFSQDKTNFMAFLCHELRNPLHAIINMIPMLDEPSLSSEEPMAAPHSTEMVASDHPVFSSYYAPQSTEKKHIADNSARSNVISTISSFGRHMLNLVSDVIDVGKFESGQVSLKTSPTIFVEVCTSLMNDFTQVVQSKGIRFQFSLDKTLPEMVRIDFIRYKQVVSNFVFNALKATKPDGLISVHVSYEWLDHTILDMDAHQGLESESVGLLSSSTTVNHNRMIVLKTTVKDTGCGIPLDEQADLFKPYRQATTNQTSENSGSGLGLAICKMIADLYHGRLALRSEIGVGSEFSFDIPVQVLSVGADKPKHSEINILVPSFGSSSTIVAPRAEEFAAQDESDTHECDMSHSTILTPRNSVECLDVSDPIAIMIVDDSLINRQILKRMLLRINPSFTITEATNGLEAVNRCQVAGMEKTLKLILMDIIMPCMNGFEASVKIREHGLTNVPIIATTANNTFTEEFSQQRSEFGMTDSLSKPFTIDTLWTMLKKYQLISA